MTPRFDNMRRPLRIGITIGLRSPDESLWTNGIKQNALYLAKLFQNSPFRHRIALLNTTGVPITDVLPWSRTEFETRQFEEAWADLDVLIELGGQIGPEQTQALKRQGTKIVSYCCGAEYVQNIEAMIFSRRLYDSVYVNRDYDVLWIIPQIWEMNRGFLQTFRRCRAVQVPFVWDPMPIEKAMEHFSDKGEYRPNPGRKRLSVIEPNIDVLKFCLYPILIAERAFRQEPERIAYLHVANAERFVHDNREFASLMRHLDIVRSGKASFIGKVMTPDFLAQHTDVVISHQWGLPLSYLYLECCWQGYPFVHNSTMIADIGYYYRGNDLDEASDCLIAVLGEHDRSWCEYRNRQRARIWRFQTENPNLIRHYDDLLFDLISGEPTIEGEQSHDQGAPRTEDAPCP